MEKLMFEPVLKSEWQLLEEKLAAERAVSDRLMEALKMVRFDIVNWTMQAHEKCDCSRLDAIIAEVEAMRKENKE